MVAKHRRLCFEFNIAGIAADLIPHGHLAAAALLSAAVVAWVYWTIAMLKEDTKR